MNIKTLMRMSSYFLSTLPKIITEMLAAVTRDRHEQCYTSNPSLMTGLESELYTRNHLIYKQLLH